MQDVGEQVVEHALRVEDVPEHQRYDDPGGYDRQVVDDPEGHAEARDGVYKHRREQAQHHLPRHCDEGVDERGGKGRAEGGVAQHGGVVCKPRKAVLEHVVPVPLEKAHVQQLQYRVDGEHCKHPHAREQEGHELYSVPPRFKLQIEAPYKKGARKVRQERSRAKSCCHLGQFQVYF